MERANVILVPMDFDEASEESLDTACWLANKLGAELCLLHANRLIVPVHPEVALAYAAGLEQDAIEAAQEALDRYAARCGGARTMVREGDPATQILAAIDEMQPVFVVMGTHGRRGVSRLLLGSVTERVLRESSAPVITVRPQAAARRQSKPAA